MDDFWNLIFGWDYIVLGLMFLPFAIAFALVSTIIDKLKGKP